MQTTELKVDGMTCGSCVASVSKALKRVPGVQGVEVDLRAGIARVRGEHAAHHVPELVAALGEAAYEARVATVAPAAAHQHPADGSRSGAGAAAKGRGGCCCD